MPLSLHSFIAPIALAVLLACSDGSATPNKAPPTTSVDDAPSGLSDEAKRIRAEACATLTEKARAEGHVALLMHTHRPVAEKADDATREAARQTAQSACERVRTRLPKEVFEHAQVGCDIAMISFSADQAMITQLCADPDVYMISENIPLSPAGGSH